MSAEIDEVIAHIDWPLLRAQKVTLLGAISNCHVSSEAAASLDGLVTLIDAIQDAAVADGAPFEEIFGKEHD